MWGGGVLPAVQGTNKARLRCLASPRPLQPCTQQVSTSCMVQGPVHMVDWVGKACSPLSLQGCPQGLEPGLGTLDLQDEQAGCNPL